MDCRRGDTDRWIPPGHAVPLAGIPHAERSGQLLGAQSRCGGVDLGFHLGDDRGIDLGSDRGVDQLTHRLGQRLVNPPQPFDVRGTQALRCSCVNSSIPALEHVLLGAVELGLRCDELERDVVGIAEFEDVVGPDVLHLFVRNPETIEFLCRGVEIRPVGHRER